MGQLEQIYILSLLVQLAHSFEELSTDFHRKWYLFKMPFWIFLIFELCFSFFWVAVLLLHNLSYRVYLQEFFLLLMFTNGIQHVVWWGNTKKYVPGLITAPIHIVVFIAYYFQRF